MRGFQHDRRDASLGELERRQRSSHPAADDDHIGFFSAGE
jgi:hypothetical protein